MTTQTQDGFTNFNRHEIFNADDRTTVSWCLKIVDNLELENKLFGLYDGYLYNDLLTLASVDFKDSSMYAQLENLVTKIKNS